MVINIRGKLLDIGLHNDFFVFDTKSKGNGKKINKWDYIRPKSYCTAKESTNKRKMEPMEW